MEIHVYKINMFVFIEPIYCKTSTNSGVNNQFGSLKFVNHTICFPLCTVFYIDNIVKYSFSVNTAGGNMASIKPIRSVSSPPFVHVSFENT